VSDATALEVNGLCAGYGRSQVLFDVALKVPPTGAVAVLGRNGVGKTTLMKAIIGELPATTVDEVVEIFPKLGQRLDQVAGTLSGGERKMLAIARALLLRPRVLLLDEPTEGVWIGVIEEIAERLHKLVETVAVVLVEQHLELALRISRYAYVLDRGRVALEGDVGAVRADPKLLQILAP
jgi:branched-chain amino acid transport system ATP-binding protein